MKTKFRKTIFICQITENFVKIAKCLMLGRLKRKFVGLEIREIKPNLEEKELTEIINEILQKLDYRNNPLIISLPRSRATTRYLRVPTQIPKEIERIVALQAPRYLPYRPEELITGYQIIATDKEGYADINLVVVHKELIERYLKIFRPLKASSLSIVLSSYGLCNLYNYLHPDEPGAVMIIDVDAFEAEIAIVEQKKLLFSRYFRFNRLETNWQSLFIDEIIKSQDAYLKEEFKKMPEKIMLMGLEKTIASFTQTLSKQTGLPIETLSASANKIDISNDLVNIFLDSDYSFASLVGLGIEEIEEYSNLLPQDVKEAVKKISQARETSRLILLVLAIILMLGLGTARNLENKALYLARLKTELNQIAKEAKPLEEIEKRFKLLETYSQKSLSVLDIIQEVYKTIPQAVTLSSFSYEEDNQITLHGQTQELDSVFTFVSQLKKTSLLKNFNIKVRYATKKKTPAGEIVDFEIVCAKGK